jgi:hypothetical protein
MQNNLVVDPDNSLVVMDTADNVKVLTVADVKPATDEQLIKYLRYSRQFSEITMHAERDLMVLELCRQLNITVSDDELQAEGDAFRKKQKLVSVAQTVNWLNRQCITPEEWTDGIRLTLLEKKLKEHLFSNTVDDMYLANRDNFRRVALSQILVYELTDALKIMKELQENNASFCQLALEHSKGKHTRENGGFVGIRLISDLMPELAQAVEGVAAGTIIDPPVKTNLGYHIIRVEKWLPSNLRTVREQMLDALFQRTLQNEIDNLAASQQVTSQAN